MKIQISVLEESRQSSAETIERQYETLNKLHSDLEQSKTCEEQLRKEIEDLQKKSENLNFDFTSIATTKEALEEESSNLRERLCDAEAEAVRVPGLENLVKGYEEVVLTQKQDLSVLHDE